MNTPIFIAKRLAGSGGNTYSRFIIRIGIIAVAVSVAVMILASSFIAGFKNEISQKIFGFWGHIHISDTAYSLSFEPQPVSNRQPFYPSLDTIRQITYVDTDLEGNVINPNAKTKGGIRHIQAFAYKPGIIRTKTAMEGIILKGIDSNFDWANLQPYLTAGKPIAYPDSAASRDIVISQQTADRLEVNVGDKFIVHFVKEGDQLRRMFTISGIYKTGLEEYDKKFALADLRITQELLGWQPDQVAGFEVWLDHISDMDVINQHIYTEQLPDTLLSVTIREKFPAIFEWLALQDYNEFVILGLMLLVAIINMVTALLVLVLERTNMIGILKAMGETNFRIQQIFLYYAAIITLYGIAWGNLIGLGICLLQDRFKFIKLNEADYYLSYAPVSIPWSTVIAINLGTLLITFVFLIFPSFVVSRISPLKAIRFK